MNLRARLSFVRSACGRRYLRDARVREMYGVYSDGFSLAEVGGRYNVTAECVRQEFRRLGLPTRSREEARRLRLAITELTIDELVERLKETGDLEFVAAEFGVSARAAQRAVRKRAPGLLARKLGKGRAPNGYWTKERILEAIQSWTRLYGKPPSATDWSPAQAKRLGHLEKVKRFEEGLWPYVNTVSHQFGGWNEAIRAAGFEPRPVSSYGRPGDDPNVVEQAVGYYRDGKPLSTAAKKAGISVATLTKALTDAGLPLPGERLVERIKAFLRGRDWTPAKTITYALPDRPTQVYAVLNELRRDPDLEFMEMAGRGVYVRPRPPKGKTESRS